jgi:hypothetical protein
MLQRIRGVLLTQYIGAIVIAMLLVNAVGGVIGGIVSNVAMYLEMRKQAARISSLGDLFRNERVASGVSWDSVLLQLLSVVLNLLVAWALLRWLFLHSDLRPSTDADDFGSEPNVQ